MFVRSDRCYSGQYRASSSERLHFSLTAGVGGMLPSKPGDLLLNTSKVYGQLYIKHNGVVIPSTYLLVKEGHVSHVEGELHLKRGDVLELFTGEFRRNFFFYLLFLKVNFEPRDTSKLVTTTLLGNYTKYQTD